MMEEKKMEARAHRVKREVENEKKEDEMVIECGG